jgi:pyrroline-5-carboxylate reductase
LKSFATQLDHPATRAFVWVVASPGGTTEMALRKFAEARFSDIVAAALQAAAERSRELGRVQAEAVPRQ